MEWRLRYYCGGEIVGGQEDEDLVKMVWELVVFQSVYAGSTWFMVIPLYVVAQFILFYVLYVKLSRSTKTLHKNVQKNDIFKQINKPCHLTSRGSNFCIRLHVSQAGSPL